MENSMKAYKVFNSDWTCRDFQYEVGKTYVHEGEVEVCGSGFHACAIPADCFNYYSFNPKNKVAEVVLSGVVETEGDKSASSVIKIVREVSWEELLTLVNIGKGNSGNRNSGHMNSGHRNSGHMNSGHMNPGDRNSGNWNPGNMNSGHRNSGDSNSGDSNSGDSNSGNWNSGNWNSGNWNSGDMNSGAFNNEQDSTIRVFGQRIERALWENFYKPSWLYFESNVWVTSSQMTEEERTENKDSESLGGYLKTLGYKEAFLASFLAASKKDQAAVRNLPAFDEEIFYDISGIKLSDYGV